MIDQLLFWGKLGGEKARPGSYHPVLCHMIDVAAVAEAMWCKAASPHLRHRIGQSLGVPEADLVRWVPLWAGLHDIGKISPAFQWRDQPFMDRQRTAGLGASLPVSKVAHGAVGTLVLEEILLGLDVSGPVARRLAAVLGGHHGVFPRSEETEGLLDHPAAVGRGGWKVARSEAATVLAGLFGPLLQPPARLDNPAAMVLAGLVSVADWVGSDERLFPYLIQGGEALPGLDPWAYLSAARRRAGAALRRLGWLGWAPPAESRPFDAIFPFAPNPLQREAVDLAARLTAPSLVIVEAPMGEGKTEAAIYLADRWASGSGVAGTYLALPTQATSNQMFGRVRDYLSRRYPSDQVNLQLLHGHASLSAEFTLLREKADSLLALGGIGGEPGYDGAPAGVLAGEWFTHRKRGLLAPLGVGTVDQALLAALQTRHVFVRLFGLAGKTVIVDEVHAYDSYMTALLDRLLEWLGALGSPVVLLSATLPRSRRTQLARAYARGIGDEAMAPSRTEPYPVVTWVAPSGSGSRHVETSARSARTVRLEWVDGRLPPGPDQPFPLGERLSRALAGGGCAAVICNTVDRAQRVYLALKPYFPDTLEDGSPELDLLHARFLFGERDHREKRALARFGREGAKITFPDGQEREVVRPRRAVLVSTQIMEQSLDIDFDLMVSDMAPVDLVLQRSGRLHRHQRPAGRPAGLEGPRLWLCAPELDADGVPAFDSGTQAIYDQHVLLRSWLALRHSESIEVPGEIESLIEEVYDDRPCPENLPEAAQVQWQHTHQRHVDDLTADTEEANERWVKRPSYSGLLWRLTGDPREEEAPNFHRGHQALTRLAEESVSAVFLYAAEERPSLLPGGMQPVSIDSVPPLSLQEALLKRSVSISDRRAVWDIKALEVPEAWRRTALLRHHRLVLLDPEHRTALKRCGIRLDAGLGVVVEKLSQ